MALDPFIILIGIFAILLVSIYVFVGIIIALKYRENKDKTYIYFGLTWMTMIEAWYAASVSFIIYLFNGVGLVNNPRLYFIIGVGFYPVASITWMLAFTELLYKKWQKPLVAIYLVIGIIYEIIFYAWLFTDPSLIAVMNGPVDSTYGILITIYVLAILLVFFVITGFLIAIKSIKSEIPEHKLRGIFLIIAIISFVIGSIIDSALELNFSTLIITRLILISSAFEFYCAFVLPKWLKKIALKE